MGFGDHSMRKKATLLAIALRLGAVAAADAPWDIRHCRTPPPPESQRAEVEVSGNVSRLVPPLDVALARRVPPEGLSCGDFVRETAGFSWYCSRHYAVKSDLPDAEAAGMLELLELAWPHLSALFGGEPLGGRARMALVAASSRRALKRAMMDDSMFAFTLGGVTQEGFGCSYLYAGTPYQTRYIVLHEATHLFQYCLTGNTRDSWGFFLEGVPDFLSSHVYDPAAHTLAVNVLDRAPIHNHLADGLAEWRGAGRPSFSAIYADPSPSRGLSVLMTAFLQSTPDFAGRWRRLCHRYAARDVPGGASGRRAFDILIGEIYGGAESLDAAWAAWAGGLSPSYSLARREFDQEGGSFVSCEPASPESPALLEWRGGARPGPASMSVRWRDAPRRGSAACVEFLMPDGSSVACVVSNSPSASLAFFEAGGVRNTSLGARRLHSLLRGGVAFRLDAEGGAVELVSRGETVASLPLPQAVGGAPCGWRISASQPGMQFTPEGAAGPDARGPRFAPPRRFRQFPAPCAGGLAPVGGWLAAGPFSLPDGKFGHCRRPPPAGPVDPESIHLLDDGTFAAWKPAALNTNAAFSACPVANLTATFGRQANDSFAYALAKVESDSERDATLVLGVSDGIEVFLNGGKLLDDVRAREWQDGNVRVPVRLRAGENELLLRLSHARGVWLLSAGLE